MERSILAGGWATPLKNMSVRIVIPNLWQNEKLIKIDVPNQQNLVMLISSPAAWEDHPWMMNEVISHKNSRDLSPRSLQKYGNFGGYTTMFEHPAESFYCSLAPTQVPQQNLDKSRVILRVSRSTMSWIDDVNYTAWGHGDVMAI